MNHLERARALTKDAQALSGQRRALGEAFAKEHLVECCVELSRERETNAFVNAGKLEQLREILDPEGNDIYLAQRMVEALAAEYIARELGSRPG